MTFRRLSFALSLAAVLGACETNQPLTEANLPAFHQSLMTLDSHVDIPLSFATEAADPGVRGNMQTDLVKMREGNLNTVFFISYVPQSRQTPEGFANAVRQARQKFDAIQRMTEQYPDQIGLARTSREVRRLRRQGKMVALIGVENGYAYGGDISLVAEYKRRGMTYSGFTHFGHSIFADSSLPLEHLGDAMTQHGGLSQRGRALLAEFNRLGIMADVSHASRATTMQVAALSTAPVIASHSAVFGVTPIARNLTDEELVAIKETGGVVQIVAFDTYLKDPAREKKRAIEALRREFGITRFTFSTLSEEKKVEYRARMEELHKQWPRATLSDFVDHIDYAVRLIGIDHVGISSDFGGGGGVTGWMNASETENVTRALAANGYSRSDIRKLWGENMLRVMDEVQSRATIN